MFSNVEAGKKIGEDSGNGKLLQDIEAISKALYLDKSRSKSSGSTLHNKSKATGKTHLEEPKSRLKEPKEELLRKEKKSIWSWKALKALTNVRNRRFNCCFSLEVHSVEGLPSHFDDHRLCVHWKRRDGELATRPARVFHGKAEFDEQLTHTCSVYGSRSGSSRSAKYEAKHYLLYAEVFGAPDLDLGKHRVDLTRLLPLSLEELEDEKSTGKWTTSFKLSGLGKGAIMNVSFGYLVIGCNSIPPAANRNIPEVCSLKRNNTGTVNPLTGIDPRDCRSTIQRTESLPAISSMASSQSVEDIKDLHEVFPISSSELSSAVTTLYQKFEEVKLDTTVGCKPDLDVSFETLKSDSYILCVSGKENAENQYENPGLSIMDGQKVASKKQVASKEGNLVAADGSEYENSHFPQVDAAGVISFEDDTKLLPQVKEPGSRRDDIVASDNVPEVDDSCTKESIMEDLESALHHVSDIALGVDFPGGESEIQCHENDVEVKSNCKTTPKVKSLTSDDVANSVASEFLDMLGIEHSPFGLSSESEPESPRERLLRQFEKDTQAAGCSLFNFDIEDENQAEFGYEAPTVSGWGTFGEDFNQYPVAEAADEKLRFATEEVRSKTRASMLEDMETEALMREWGIDETSFQHSPPNSSCGFGSPIDLSSEEPLQLPSLGEGLGPFVQTKSGGFLRSMDPALFTNAKNGCSLIMQVSSPVVVPAEMGSSIMEILHGLASVGIEKLSMHANKLMPLEDITGKTIQQIAWEASHSLEAHEREILLQHESKAGQNTDDGQKGIKGESSRLRSSKVNLSSIGKDMDLEYVYLEDLAPSAMDKIEALSIEGLRIQSGMSDQDAPSNISPQSIGQISVLEGKRVNVGGSLGLEGAGGLQLLDIKDSIDDVDGLMGLSLTLDEWMRLDSGEIEDEDQISERTSKILAAHRATCTDLIFGKAEKKRGKGSGRRYGLLGNNFTVALMVQLRDPLRNYEPVGTPLLALIQVERVFVPPKVNIQTTISEVRTNNEDDDESEPGPGRKEEIKQEPKEEEIPGEEGIPKFKIAEVHVAGLKTAPEKKKIWGSTTKQQSGSRWLLANGMAKNNKHPFMKSKAVAKSTLPSTTTVQPGDTLWSISARVHGTGTKWKELAKLNQHIRNPNIILPNETIKLC